MKIELSKDLLVKAAERCSAVADPQGMHPHIGKVLLTASGEGEQQVLQAYATDLKRQIDTAVSATVHKPGTTAVDCKGLLGVAKAMPKGMITLESKRERRLVVSCSGNRTYALPTVAADMFPTPKEPGESAERLEIEARVLASMISRVQPSVAAEGRPNLEGVFLDFRDGVLNAVAVGSHTIGVVYESSIKREEPWAALLPQCALKPTLALCNDNKHVTLVHEDPLIYVESEDTLIGAMLPGQPFVPWRNGVEGLSRTRVARIPAIQLGDAVKAVMAPRREPTSPVSLVLQNDRLRIALVGEDCKAEDEVAVEALDRPELRVLLRPDYLMEAIRGADAIFTLEDAGQSVVVSTDEYLGIVSLVDPQAWPGAFG